ncbi:hypothetical protein ACEWY4_001967 [Coilia grayii]|uniref:Ig-like domain-containing protein n=1 Tax=Coilia grayii TaxID=363190 RepID=A0ABD1KUF5_9TELE
MTQNTLNNFAFILSSIPVSILSSHSLYSHSAALVNPVFKQETVKLGDKLELNCSVTEYIHLVEHGLVNITWEATGKDVVSYDGSNFYFGTAFGPRVSAHVDSAGVFSVTLEPVVMSDADMYECFLEGKRILAIVIVTVVSDPDTHVKSIVINELDDVRLPCLGRISKSATLDKVTVYWKRNDTVIYSLIDGRPPNHPSFWYNNAFMNPDIIQIYGDLSLLIINVSQKDSGIYKCSYSNKNLAADENAGIVTLTVLGHSTTEEVDELMWYNISTNTSSSPSTTPYPTTNPTPISTERESVEGEFIHTLNARAEEEIGPQVPWVLIGIITGVLILTALILALLVAMGKI